MYLKTPILSQHLNDRTFFLKMDCDQPSGSFKIRGMTELIENCIHDGYSTFISSSGGNAGYSAAMICAEKGKDMLVVVPETTTQKAKELIESTGAKLLVYGKDWYEADQKAQEKVELFDAAYIHPFDDPLLWQGHASVILEDVYASKPDAVVCSVGGGGLLAGVASALYDKGWEDVPIIACETEGAASLSKSIQAGKIITLEEIDTVATSLGARRVCDAAWRVTQNFKVIPQVVSDEQAVYARDKFQEEFNKNVEPACGASLAVMYDNLVPEFENVLMIVCGGVTWTAD